MIAVVFVPIHDHFGVVVAVAPERVRMQIAFVPVLGVAKMATTDSERKKKQTHEQRK